MSEANNSEEFILKVWIPNTATRQTLKNITKNCILFEIWKKNSCKFLREFWFLSNNFKTVGKFCKYHCSRFSTVDNQIIETNLQGFLTAVNQTIAPSRLILVHFPNQDPWGPEKTHRELHFPIFYRRSSSGLLLRPLEYRIVTRRVLLFIHWTFRSREVIKEVRS